MKAILLVEHSTVFQTGLRLALVKLGFTVFLPPRQPPEKGAAVLLDAITMGVNCQQFESLVRDYSRFGPVLLLASENHVQQIVAGLRGGAVGFLKSAVSPRELCAAIRMVGLGRAWCDVDLLRLVTKYLPMVPALRTPSMTKREQEVLSSVRSGQSNKEIALQLGVTEQSVKVYVSNLLRKTGATNRHELSYLLVGTSTVSSL